MAGSDGRDPAVTFAPAQAGATAGTDVLLHAVAGVVG